MIYVNPLPVTLTPHFPWKWIWFIYSSESFNPINPQVQYLLRRLLDVGAIIPAREESRQQRALRRAAQKQDPRLVSVSQHTHLLSLFWGSARALVQGV